MKIATAALLSASASAFAPTAPLGARSSTALFNARVDSGDAVKAALEASKKYGPTSKEARVAWDIVEEMDASDNSVAYNDDVGVDPDECLMSDGSDPKCQEYDKKIAELSKLIEEQKAKMDKVKTLAQEIRQVKFTKPSGGNKAPDSPQMRAALAEAKKLTEEHGLDSTEAKLAWENVEEIASSDISEATKGTLDDECLVETIEACEAIEELQSALKKIA